MGAVVAPNLAMSTQQSAGGASTLSVIIPNYNHGRYIGRAIEALLSQTHVPDEIIIVDDASTDDSLIVIQDLAAKSPRIAVIVQPANMGTNAALREGLERAKGRYILLAGADDWTLPGFCELGLRMLTAHPEVGLFCGDTVLVDGETGRTIGYRPPARPLYRPGAVPPAACRRLLARMDNFIHTGSTIFRRDAIVAANGLKDDLGAFADGFLTRKIALTAGFCYAPCVVACWRIFRSGLSRTTALDPLKAQDALRLYPAKIASDTAFPDWYADVFRERWRFATARLALQADAPDFAFIYDMGARSQIDRAVLTLLRTTLRGGAMRAAMLGWLWLRLRPYRLTDVAATAVLRMFERIMGSRAGAIRRRV
jgi:glycosyltransferase involved in cell wall biosynthesis